MPYIHIAVFNGKELEPMCGSTADECWVMNKKDATCKKCLRESLEFDLKTKVN